MTKLASKNQRPFAAFDIDGTLIRWQLYHAVTDELGRNGHIDAARYAEVKAARHAWKRREAGANFDSYEQSLVRAYQDSIKDISVSDVQTAIDSAFAEYRDQTYSYTRNLIASLKEQGYLLFAISGSQAEIVQKLAAHYGFDASIGTSYVVEDGVYTGESDVVRSARKPELLKAMIQEYDATLRGSYAVGDSESDIPMLEIVEQPIAFNPTNGLFEHAKANNWQIAVERKNTIYELVPGKAGYTLR